MLMQTIGFVLSISGLFLLPNTAFFQNKEVTFAVISIIAAPGWWAGRHVFLQNLYGFIS
ncbi:MAG: hypothetical protein K6U80_03910 [Firmicutes bacterium]|nr:hypothetical protein [Bacillota bacterium]